MPSYTFKDKDGEYFEASLSISEKEEFLKDNPDISQVIQAPNIVAGVGGMRNDEGWKEVLSKVGEAHPGSAIDQRYNRRSAKEVKTENAVERWRKQTGRV